jgi:predicted nucleic acid-binding Zn ribbon protein
MGKEKTRTCPFCHEKVPRKATRCKSCGSTLPEIKHSLKNYLTLLFFLTTILFAVLAFTWYDHLERERNRTTQLERRNSELQESLLDCYESAGEAEIENDSFEAVGN